MQKLFRDKVVALADISDPLDDPFNPIYGDYQLSYITLGGITGLICRDTYQAIIKGYFTTTASLFTESGLVCNYAIPVPKGKSNRLRGMEKYIYPFMKITKLVPASPDIDYAKDNQAIPVGIYESLPEELRKYHKCFSKKERTFKTEVHWELIGFLRFEELPKRIFSYVESGRWGEGTHIYNFRKEKEYYSTFFYCEDR